MVTAKELYMMHCLAEPVALLLYMKICYRDGRLGFKNISIINAVKTVA
jgi:hypothetical protein